MQTSITERYSSQLLNWHLRDNLFARADDGRKKSFVEKRTDCWHVGAINRSAQQQKGKEREGNQKGNERTIVDWRHLCKHARLNSLARYLISIRLQNLTNARHYSQLVGGRSPSLSFPFSLVLRSRTLPRWITIYGAIDHLSLWRLFYGGDNESIHRRGTGDFVTVWPPRVGSWKSFWRYIRCIWQEGGFFFL